MIVGFENSKVQTIMLNHATMTPQKNSRLHIELPIVFPSTLNPKCWKSNIDMMAVIRKTKANICQQRWWWWWLIQIVEAWPRKLSIELDQQSNRTNIWQQYFSTICRQNNTTNICQQWWWRLIQVVAWPRKLTVEPVQQNRLVRDNSRGYDDRGHLSWSSWSSSKKLKTWLLLVL